MERFSVKRKANHGRGDEENRGAITPTHLKSHTARSNQNLQERKEGATTGTETTMRGTSYGGEDRDARDAHEKAHRHPAKDGGERHPTHLQTHQVKEMEDPGEMRQGREDQTTPNNYTHQWERCLAEETSHSITNILRTYNDRRCEREGGTDSNNQKVARSCSVRRKQDNDRSRDWSYHLSGWVPLTETAAECRARPATQSPDMRVPRAINVHRNITQAQHPPPCDRHR